MAQKCKDSFSALKTLKVGEKSYQYFDLKKVEGLGGAGISRLPFSLKILLENLLRHEDGESVRKSDIEALLAWDPQKKPDQEISFTPSRVVLQDFTGVPAVVDLAVMRDALVKLGGSAQKINPLLPVELVIDHSVQVDHFGSAQSFQQNVDVEYQRNQERYVFLRWGQKAFKNFKVVPPGTGIVHQVNLEFLARVVMTNDDGFVFPDTIVGTDSHTTMVNGLGVLGWGVGGIEAEAAMLGQPSPMLIPQVIGFKLHGKLPEGSTATDLVLTVTEILRQKKVVGSFVEFFGEGVAQLPLADRATIGNMSPEYGSTCAIFPIDEETLNYLRFSGRSEAQVALVEAYAKAQGLFHQPGGPDPLFTDVVSLDLSTVEPCIAGPKRPQDRVALKQAKERYLKAFPHKDNGHAREVPVSYVHEKRGPLTFKLPEGAVVIAAITSCTNTSNPNVMMGAGILAKKAIERGLMVKPWVKTSLAPGSKVVTDYLEKSGVQNALDQLGFQLVGYGCTTCIGNSGPLPEPISKAIRENDLMTCSVLSGNRNFEGRVHPDTRANYLASPPLVVAYALVGKMDFDFFNEPIGVDSKGQKVFLKDIWPTQKEISETLSKALSPESFKRKYADVFSGDTLWQDLDTPEGERFAWAENSTYIRKPTFFDHMKANPEALVDICNARALAVLGDSITTDHISPAGNISKTSPAAKYLQEQGVAPEDFNSYGARRGNHEVMVRGTFANIRLKNEMLGGKEGGLTRHIPSQSEMTIFDAAMKYQQEKTPLVIIAGKEYGSGSSRDWAAKGTFLLGVKAVVAESYERIHRSNLIGMGVLPLEFLPGESRKTVGLHGEEVFSIAGIAEDLTPGKTLTVKVAKKDGGKIQFQVKCRIDTPVELKYFKHGGILHYVLRGLR